MKFALKMSKIQMRSYFYRYWTNVKKMRIDENK